MDRTTAALEELLNTVKALRAPGGCNWDRSQTLKSLRPFLLEEAYEVADAVDSGDMQELRKELGDLLLHIFMSAEICRENGAFDLSEVARKITEKLKRRHPHVFDKSSPLTPEEVEKQWEAIKSREKSRQKKNFFDSVPSSMPALQKAWRIQQRASEIGFTWDTPSLMKTEIIDLLNANEITGEIVGRILFLLTNLARVSGIEPEQALRERNKDFTGRFDHLEELLSAEGCSLSSADMSMLKESITIAFREK
jgi:MazG family protein